MEVTSVSRLTTLEYSLSSYAPLREFHHSQCHDQCALCFLCCGGITSVIPSLSIVRNMGGSQGLPCTDVSGCTLSQPPLVPAVIRLISADLIPSVTAFGVMLLAEWDEVESRMFLTACCVAHVVHLQPLRAVAYFAVAAMLLKCLCAFSLPLLGAVIRRGPLSECGSKGDGVSVACSQGHYAVHCALQYVCDKRE